MTDFLVTLGPWGVLLLAFVDSAGIPLSVGVDALILLLAVRSPDTAILNVALAVAGSTIGTLGLFYAARKGGQKYVDREAPESRTGRFRAWFRNYGLLTVFVPSAVPFPMPMKPFVILSGAFGIRTLMFTAVVVVGRILRYGGEAWLGVQMGEHSGQYLKDHRWHLLAFGFGLFAVLFLFAKLRARDSHGPADV